MKKRDFLRLIGSFGAGTMLMGCDPTKKSGGPKASPAPSLPPVPIVDAAPLKLRAKPFELPPLPFPTDALEPNIDKLTMEIHHDRHHKAYVDNLNAASAASRFKDWELSDIFNVIGADDPAAVRNNGGGHWNHSFFWESLRPAGGGLTGGDLQTAIRAQFGSLEKMQEAFTAAAKGVFGSGWAWLCKDEMGKLFISSTPNQDNPLMKKLAKLPGTPLLGLDVWEHAYYLKYQNKRADYIANFWNVVNWDKVAERFSAKK